MASEPRGADDGVGDSAQDLADPGRGPTPLTRPFTLGPPLPEMAGLPELGAAHRGWVEVAAAGADGPGPRGVPARLSRLARGALRRLPEDRHQQELLDQLTRIVDALAKRCDELERRLRLLNDETAELATVLSEDLTRVTALVASLEDGSAEPDG